MHTIILGDGHLGQRHRGQRPRRAANDSSSSGGPRPAGMTGRRSRAPISSSTPRAATPSRANVEVALEAGVRRFVIATTGWADDRPTVERDLRDARSGGGRRPRTSASGWPSSSGSPRRRRGCSARVDGVRPVSSSSGIGARSADRPSGTAPGAGPADGGRASRSHDARSTTSRSCRSGPGRRPACTSSASMPPARPSSSGSPPATGRPTRPGAWPPRTGCEGRHAHGRPAPIRHRRRRPLAPGRPP